MLQLQDILMTLGGNSVLKIQNDIKDSNCLQFTYKAHNKLTITCIFYNFFEWEDLIELHLKKNQNLH
jgi:Ran GTPase-activating protein (RanGAP) involved in mRNA processing and transport